MAGGGGQTSVFHSLRPSLGFTENSSKKLMIFNGQQLCGGKMMSRVKGQNGKCGLIESWCQNPRITSDLLLIVTVFQYNIER